MCDRFDIQLTRVEPPRRVVLVQPPLSPLRSNRADQRRFGTAILTRHSHEPIRTCKDEQSTQRLNVSTDIYQFPYGAFVIPAAHRKLFESATVFDEKLSDGYCLVRETTLGGEASEVILQWDSGEPGCET